MKFERVSVKIKTQWLLEECVAIYNCARGTCCNAGAVEEVGLWGGERACLGRYPGAGAVGKRQL